LAGVDAHDVLRAGGHHHDAIDERTKTPGCRPDFDSVLAPLDIHARQSTGMFIP